MLALRFVVGLFEAGYWPALYYILGSWYNKRASFSSSLRHLLTNRSGELGKRNGILQSAVSIAPIFSGFLQAGIYDSLNGHAGLAGWRWLFGKFLCTPFLLPLLSKVLQSSTVWFLSQLPSSPTSSCPTSLVTRSLIGYFPSGKSNLRGRECQ